MRISKAIGSIFLLCLAISIAPGALAQSGQVKAVGSVVVPVPYATDRKVISNGVSHDGAEISQLWNGVAKVRLPARPGWFENGKLKPDLAALGWYYKSEEAIDPILPIKPEGYVVGNNAKNLVQIGQSGTAWDQLDQQLSAGSQEVFVYVHGFAASGVNAIYASGILASELRAPVVCFTWPSYGKYSPNTSTLFENDRAILEGDSVLKDFEAFVSMLVDRYPSVRVSLIAHSLGNRLVIRHFEKEGNIPWRYKTIIFVAADVQKDRFERIAPEVIESADYVAAYSSPKDRVLFGSKLNGLFRERTWIGRLGKSREFVAGMDFVDYTKIAEPKALKHYIRFDDLGSMLRLGRPAVRSNGSRSYTALKRITIREAN